VLAQRVGDVDVEAFDLAARPGLAERWIGALDADLELRLRRDRRNACKRCTQGERRRERWESLHAGPRAKDDCAQV
jgi:hypothetical protein